MKRNIDIIREILISLEDKTGSNLYVIEYAEIIPRNEDIETLRYHAKLLIDAGYINGSIAMNHLMFNGLTWHGHDFIDSIRDDGIWAETKTTAQKVGGWTLSTLSEIAKAIIKEKISKHIGINL